MRMYLKLLLMILVFACASNSRCRQMSSDLAYDARVAFVWRFGSAADYEALVDDTQHMLACQQGNLDLYRNGKRYRQLLAQRLADAARLKTSLTDEDLARIAAEAFGRPAILRDESLADERHSSARSG